MSRHPILYLIIAVFLVVGKGAAAAPPDSRIRSELLDLFESPPEVGGFPYQTELTAASERYGLPLPLILAVVRGESFFDPKAKSVKGALGLMQVMPSTAADYGLTSKDLLKPGLNIDVGVHYLADLYARLKDPYLALGAYYCGSGGVNTDKASLRGECDEYVRYIYSHLQKILAAGRGGASPARMAEEKRLVLARFDNFLDAERFFNLLSEKLPQLQADLFRAEENHRGYVRHQYQILLGSDRQEKDEDPCRAIEKVTGFTLCR